MRKAVWHAKNRVRQTPGVYPLWKWLLARQHGKIRRIPFGPLRGCWWETAEGLPLWYRLGLYEPHVSDLLQSYLNERGVLWDVGANAGYHSLLGAKLCSHVVSVEADSRMAALIARQRDINELRNWNVVAVAVADSEGTAEFVRMPNPLQSGLAAVGTQGASLTVSTTTLDSLLNDHPTPTVVKIDVEGAETLTLRGAERLLGERPVMLVSTHGHHREACETILRRAGYSTRAQPGFEQMLIGHPASSDEALT